MKSTLFISAFLLLSFWSNAQLKVESGIEQINMSKGQQMAFTVTIPEAKAKGIEPIWKKYVNNRSMGERFSNFSTQIGNLFRSKEKQSDRDKLKVEKNGDEFYVRAIKETSLTRHPIDVYARITEFADHCKFSAFFQYTDSVFIDETNADQERIQNIKSYIRDFGVLAYQSIVEDQIDAAKKVVSKEEKQLKGIELDSKKKEKSISRYEADIQEYNAGITTTEADIARLEDNITNKKMAFEMLTKESPEYDATKQELRELSKQKSQYFSKIKSLKSKVKSKEMDIKSGRKKIDQNDLLAKKQQDVIDAKQEIVDQLKEKKDAIQ